MSKLESSSYDKPLEDLQEVNGDSDNLKNILKEYNYDSYFDDIYKKNITAYYANEIKSAVTESYISTCIESLQTNISSLSKYNITVSDWDFALFSINHHKMIERLDQFVLLVNERYKAKK